LKKILVGLFALVAMTFLYVYQPPILSTGEAIAIAVKQLQHPPKEISAENLEVSLIQQPRFWSKLTNRMQWEITLKYNGTEQTVIIDAYSGKFIGIYGPLN
jgi:uncharacterized membrane protein YkoI